MKRIWGIFWTIIVLTGGYALWTVLQLPSESKNAVWIGLSAGKLVLCGIMAGLILTALAGAVLSFINRDNIFSSGKAAGIMSFFITFAMILGVIFLTPPVGKTAYERSLLERLTPLAYWGLVFVSLSVILLIIQKFSWLKEYQTGAVSALLWGLIILAAAALILTSALYTGVGIDPISGTFYRQGVSLLEGHLIVPLLFLYPLLPLMTIISRKFSGKKVLPVLAFLCGIAIWCAAVWLWQTTVFEGRSYFAPALRLPNNNFYPASDAENYDLLAQSILLGNGFRNGMTVVRPLYAAFLALLHFIFGNDYMKVTNGQILLLALIPVLIFLIGKYLRHPAAGLVVAAWVIWREIYSIRLTPLVQVSNSRLLMSDLPTFLMTALVILCTVKWIHSEKNAAFSLLCGGMIGTAMLLRTQCFVLIPVLWLVFICSAKKSPAKWISFLMSLIGIAVVFVPWTVWGIIHPNTTVNAEVSEGQYLISLYRTASGETDPDADLWKIIKDHPGETAKSVAAHFINNEISSLLILPVRLTKPEETDQLFYEPDLFWYRENARETIENNIFMIVVYLVLITMGVISACRRNGSGGVIPLLFHLAYNLGNALALTSGFRFILPSDWVFLFYFGMGCAALLEFLNRVFLFDRQDHMEKTEKIDTAAVYAETKGGGQGWAVVCSFFLLALIGSILPLCDAAIPRRFTARTSAELEAEWNSAAEGSIDLSGYRNENIVYLEGRAFYPRYYKAGEGDSGGSSSAKREMNKDRMVWMFHDDRVHVLSCPLTGDQIPAMTQTEIPDPMDVLVVGIQRDDYVEVLQMRRIAAD